MLVTLHVLFLEHYRGNNPLPRARPVFHLSTPDGALTPHPRQAGTGWGVAPSFLGKLKILGTRL